MDTYGYGYWIWIYRGIYIYICIFMRMCVCFMIRNIKLSVLKSCYIGFILLLFLFIKHSG